MDGLDDLSVVGSQWLPPSCTALHLDLTSTGVGPVSLGRLLATVRGVNTVTVNVAHNPLTDLSALLPLREANPGIQELHLAAGWTREVRPHRSHRPARSERGAQAMVRTANALVLGLPRLTRTGDGRCVSARLRYHCR